MSERNRCTVCGRGSGPPQVPRSEVAGKVVIASDDHDQGLFEHWERRTARGARARWLVQRPDGVVVEAPVVVRDGKAWLEHRSVPPGTFDAEGVYAVQLEVQVPLEDLKMRGSSAVFEVVDG